MLMSQQTISSVEQIVKNSIKALKQLLDSERGLILDDCINELH